ncbi:PREDICTED: nuclear pore complex protein Nup88 isoform X1 [Wasmannia auropunctata]|uniref:nuclear pore complex protein Nup88 isoform X1 n=2 Tax=Wasmannia auropunctata TaxID=64793 RepID=UPI0005F0B400|nr:PREDICTED: nuclear pore complex protein Nup88 isoform X1 [Wasmannia auropunctata]
MSSCTDLLRLNEKGLFKDVKVSLSRSAKETRNILEIRDNVLYVWNADKCCVLTLNVAATRGKLDEDIPYQTLRPTDPPIFEVTNVLINETATQLALWGKLGIALMELPKRWGKDAVYEGGKEEILCTNHNFGDFGATTEIQRVRWHPGSTNDSHLLILTSENSFCLYECELGGAPRLVKCWKVGRAPSSSPSKIPDFTSLGETAVDFDFATPTLRKPELFANKNTNEIKEAVDWNQIEWPILVLRGNGEVLIVRGNFLLENYENPVVLGSLSMYPSTDDNYGIDSCSIMCLQTTPPIVVIAMCTGKIYHAILLREISDDDDDDRKTWSQYGSNYSLHTPDDALYVYECVELELGLLFTDDDKKYNCPIHLHCDKGNKSRYFCSHNAGIHMVSLPMVSQLEELIHDNSGNYLPSLLNQSVLQYLFSTRTKHTNVDEATPILGFGLLQEPCVLVALLHTGVVIDLSVIDLYYLPRIEQLEPVMNLTKKVNKEPFDVYIKKLLRRETSQPITKIGSRSMSLSESLELLYHATNIFRTQHFVRHDKVREEISKKVRALKALKSHLLKELDTLTETKKELRQTAELLAERYEDINDKQKELARRAEEVLRLVNYKEPSMTSVERAEAEELKKMDVKIHDMKIRLEQLKKKSAQQTAHTNGTEVNGKTKEIVFTHNQEEAVKETLCQMAKNIKNLVDQAKQIRAEISLSYISKQ